MATPEGYAALLHAVAHIEFNAINLALDAVWRFADMPAQYYRDWLQVAAEEGKHFLLLRDHLRQHHGLVAAAGADVEHAAKLAVGPAQAALQQQLPAAAPNEGREREGWLAACGEQHRTNQNALLDCLPT